MTYVATINERERRVELLHPDEIQLDDTRHRIDLKAIDGEYLYSLLLDDASYEVFVERTGNVYYVTVAGHRYAVTVEDERLRRLRQAGQVKHEEPGTAEVMAPMPGQVIRVLAQVGELVEADQAVVILEAMKMENEVRSPRSGLVSHMEVGVGQVVNGGDRLFVVSDAPSGEVGQGPRDRVAEGSAPASSVDQSSTTEVVQEVGRSSSDQPAAAVGRRPGDALETEPAANPARQARLVCDGGSLGNPGRGYGSFRWQLGSDPWSEPVRLSFGERTTNNEAEYQALIAALETLAQEVASPEHVSLEVLTDSRLLAQQMSGHWKLRAANLFDLHDRAQRAAAMFRRVTFRWLPRSRIVELLGH